MPHSALPPFISDRVHAGRYFFLDLAPPADVKLAVVCGGRETCDPNFLIDRAQFPYFALEYVADGEGVFFAGGVEHRLQPGSVFGYGPGLPHRLISSSKRPMLKYFVDFAGRSAPALLRQANLAAGAPRQLVQTRWFHNLFDQLNDACDPPGPFTQRHARLLLKTMVSHLILHTRDARQLQSPAYETYCRCRQHAEQHYLTLATAAAWAEACCLDPAYLSRLFKRYGHQKPYQFLLQLKMDHAADLLARQRVSVKQAAQQIGFHDPQHFSRVFKRTRGLCPTHLVRLALGR
jgi:AraC-like DNA-binding protein